MARYIVTGGSGFIGQTLVQVLEQSGHEVIVAGRRPCTDNKTKWIEYDLQKPDTVTNLIDLRPDGVFHLAWSTMPGSAEHLPGVDVHSNVAGSVELFRALQETGVRTVFISSGGAVYGRTAETAVSEEHPVKPIGVYGMGKLAAEQYAELHQRTYGFDVRIARLGNPYGSNITEGRAQGAASIFARQIISRNEICLMGDGGIVRDYIDVESAALALSALMRVELNQKSENTIFNVGSGIGLSLTELISLLEEITGIQARVRRASGRPFDVPYNVLDIKKIGLIAGWRPSIRIRDGLTRLVDKIKTESVV